MTLKNIIIAASLALTVAAAAFAEEPKNTPAPGAAPAATAPSASAPAATPGAPAITAPGAATPAAAALKPKRELKANKAITLSMFAVIIGITLGVVVWAARQTKTTADFYAAGGGITGTQNGWAIAGDYMSAASFLGISGMISLYGYDGFMYSVGWLVAYITVLLIVAEPCRNAGKYTLGDILSFRTDPKPVRAADCVQTSELQLSLTLTEGKYHQVKRMIAAVGNRVEGLHRSRIGSLALPADLQPGEWRWLTADDLLAIAAVAVKK